jgi:putative CocE/NonD family hydrolase
MTIMSRLMARMFKLPAAETYDVVVEKKLQVPMPDGVVLFADRYYPRRLGKRPTILIRTAYGRDNAGFVCRLLAERGLQVVIQSSRGTDDSGGEFNPFRQEHVDGVATLAWLKTQDWFNGELGMTGASYLGFTQWAMAHEAGPLLKAMSTQTISADFHSMLYHGHAFALELWLWWTSQMHAARKNSPLLTFAYLLKINRKPKAALQHLPLIEMDKIAFDQSYAFWREWLTHPQANDTYWEGSDFRDTLAEITTPNHMIDGWYDFFLPHLLCDYQILEQAGRRPYLTIGPWTHFDTELQSTGMREGLTWLRAHLLGQHHLLRDAPVRVFVMGANEWRDFPVWPPPATRSQPWYLQSEGNLAVNLPSDSQPDSYRYDPSDPTPSISGFGRPLRTGRGSEDNRRLEMRPDVLIYTSSPLTSDMDVIGTVCAELFARSSLEHTDFFVRLCDVHPSGRSMNVCDGLLRLMPGQPAPMPDGCLKIVINLWPTAYRFRNGHRIRLQVSSGSFPRWARNTGSSEPLATATTLKVADQLVYHDPAHPSAIILPVQT